MSWEKAKIKDVCEGIYDGPHATPPVSNDGAIFLGISNITQDGHLDISNPKYISEDDFPRWTKRVIPQGGDIVFSYEATLNLYAVIPDGFRGCLGRRMALIRPDETKVNGRFLYYYFFSEKWRSIVSENTVIGATVDRIPLIRFPDFLISFPSLEEQKAIAGILSAYDNLIENNQKQIKLLEEAAQRLYKEWFVDLRFPGHENTKIVDGIPEGWHCVRITDLLEIKYGKDHKSLENGNIPAYGSGGIIRSVNKVIYSGESVLIPRKGSLNNIMLVNGDFWTIDTMFFTIPQCPNITKYVYLYLAGVDMYAMNIGAAVPSMTVKILDGMKLLCPSSEILEQFENKISSCFSLINRCKEMNRDLGRARDLLLSKLMNREIEV